MAIEIPRRRFLLGLGALVAAPTVVRAASLMPVRTVPAPFRLADVDLTRMRNDPIEFLRVMMPDLVVEDWQKDILRRMEDSRWRLLT